MKTKSLTARLLKRLTGLLLALLLLLGAFPLTAFAAEAAAQTSFGDVVTHNTPAIFAQTGSTVTLTDYSVMFSAENLTAADHISWSSNAITVTDGKVTPAQKGVYPLTATAGALARSVYLVVKDASDTEWVIYEESFDSATSLEELGYSSIEKTDGATTTLENGKLVVASALTTNSYNRVLLPAWLGNFGDYTIDASIAIPAYQANNRWIGLMLRVQENATYTPYYQMSVRPLSTLENGVEVAYAQSKSTESPYAVSWNVLSALPHTEAVADTAYHTMTVVASGDSVRTLIDGDLIAQGAYLTDCDTGMIGFQTRSCVLSVDSVRVTLPAPAEPSDPAKVEDPASDIVLPAAMVTYVDTAEDLFEIETAVCTSDIAPATAVFRVDHQLRVLDASNTVITSAENALKALHGAVIPAFYVENAFAVNALCQWLQSTGIQDVFVLSDQAALIEHARNTYGLCRGVLDLSEKTDLTAQELANIREQTNACGARICILPTHLATRDNVELLQQLLITVWVRPAADTAVELVRAITSGANGILTQNYSLLASCYTDYFMPGTLIRTGGIIGHRGSPIYAQENTIEGSLLAYELGATAIENDVYLTKDGVIVIMHDATIDGTTNGTGRVKDFTYAELQQYMVNDNPAVAAKPIPRLEEYFETFKGKDVQIIIEVKDTSTDICAPLVKLIKSYGMLNQVNVISFHANILLTLKELCPELSVGFLISPNMGTKEEIESDPTAALKTILEQVQLYDSTFNPNYSTIGPALIKAAAYRGISILPWTINQQSALDAYFLAGAHTITTDYIQRLSSYIKRLTTDQAAYTAGGAGAEIPLTVSAIAYDRTVTQIQKGTLTVVEHTPGFSCSYENGILKTDGIGSATLLLSASFFTESGGMYSVCSELFTVTVGADVEGAPEEENTGSTGDPSANKPSSAKTLSTVAIILSSVAIAGSAAAITLLTVFAVRKRKAQKAPKDES